MIPFYFALDWYFFKLGCRDCRKNYFKPRAWHSYCFEKFGHYV